MKKGSVFTLLQLLKVGTKSTDGAWAAKQNVLYVEKSPRHKGFGTRIAVSPGPL